LSMWEETYFSSKRSGKVLSTIRTVPLQITRQSITSVLVKRLQYLIKQIQAGKESLTLLDENLCDKQTFCDFLILILKSLLVDNRRVRMFLELVALGNIRGALEMFHAFLTAGSLETKKIIGNMKENSSYLVPVHEFIKSVMLGSRRYYSENLSDILNVFAVGDLERPSHFTRLRVLQWLYERRYEATQFGGTGLLSIDILTDYFQRVGVSKKDVQVSLKHLIEGALVENDLRSQQLIAEAQAVRITPTGRYYLSHLHKQFPYMDLAIQDTPIFDRVVFQSLDSDCPSIDMPVRFRRCETFLAYLEDQENEELITIEKIAKNVTWRRRFVPNMRGVYENTKRRIQEKGY
jgi:hypothetical protein